MPGTWQAHFALSSTSSILERQAPESRLFMRKLNLREAQEAREGRHRPDPKHAWLQSPDHAYFPVCPPRLTLKADIKEKAVR